MFEPYLKEEIVPKLKEIREDLSRLFVSEIPEGEHRRIKQAGMQLGYVVGALEGLLPRQFLETISAVPMLTRICMVDDYHRWEGSVRQVRVPEGCRGATMNLGGFGEVYYIGGFRAMRAFEEVLKELEYKVKAKHEVKHEPSDEGLTLLGFPIKLSEGVSIDGAVVLGDLGEVFGLPLTEQEDVEVPNEDS